MKKLRFFCVRYQIPEIAVTSEVQTPGLWFEAPPTGDDATEYVIDDCAIDAHGTTVLWREQPVLVRTPSDLGNDLAGAEPSALEYVSIQPTLRQENCIWCTHPVPVVSYTTKHVEAPEFMQGVDTERPWFAFVFVADGTGAKLIVACSSECARNFLNSGG